MTPIPGTPTTGIIICGLPGSGNSLIQRLLAARRDLVHAIVMHAGAFEHYVENWRRGGMVARAICPVRDLEMHRISCAHNKRQSWEPGYDAWALDLYQRSTACLAALSVPVLPISYSRMVREPDEVGRRIAKWARVPWEGWPEEVFDADEKWRT